MDNDIIRQVGFDNISGGEAIKFENRGIAFLSRLHELPMVDGSMQLDMFVITICMRGKMHVEINAGTFTLNHREILVCQPNDIIENCMVTPDFDGASICLSHRWLLEHISESDLWNKAFVFSDCPVVKVSEESLATLAMYGSVLSVKLKKSERPYDRNIIDLMVTSMLYELLGSVESDRVGGYGKSLIRQRDVLFKRFIELLAGTRIKPRSVVWYADRLCVSAKHLSTVCRKTSGRTALAWINEYVMIDVRHWLKHSNRSIKEIADMLKFPSLSFFGKYCRTRFGMSPGQLRKHLREPDDGRIE